MLSDAASDPLLRTAIMPMVSLLPLRQRCGDVGGAACGTRLGSSRSLFMYGAALRGAGRAAGPLPASHRQHQHQACTIAGRSSGGGSGRGGSGRGSGAKGGSLQDGWNGRYSGEPKGSQRPDEPSRSTRQPPRQPSGRLGSDDGRPSGNSRSRSGSRRGGGPSLRIHDNPSRSGGSNGRGGSGGGGDGDAGPSAQLDELLERYMGDVLASSDTGEAVRTGARRGAHVHTCADMRAVSGPCGGASPGLSHSAKPESHSANPSQVGGKMLRPGFFALELLQKLVRFPWLQSTASGGAAADGRAPLGGSAHLRSRSRWSRRGRRAGR